ncbi:MAG: alpha/beta fold hydrolase [Anaerolineae bacterium]
MPFADVGGGSVYYVHRRPAIDRQLPVVFIHGAGGSHQHWLYQVRDLPHAPTYALDLPGHGRSEGPGRDTIGAYGDWLISFLDALGLARVVLVGHSMGGAISLDVALRFPWRVAGLGLVGTGARLRVAPAILEGIRQDFQGAVDLVCQWAFGPQAPAEMVRQSRRQMGKTPAEVLYGDFIACDRFDVMNRLGEITVPAVVAAGSQDVLTPPKYATYLRDHLPRATLHLIDGAGHMLMLENPSAVVQALAALLAEVV